MRKNVAFKFRIDEELRQAFVETCRSQDRPAAQVLREFMRSYVDGDSDVIKQAREAKRKVNRKRIASKIGRSNGAKPAKR